MTKHVIIGGGPVATNAIETIRQYGDGEASITLISDEPAHSRMALPYWLAGKVPREHTHTADDDYFGRLGVDAKIGQRASGIDTAARTVTLDDGSTVEYDNLLIATGAAPAGLPVPGADLPGVQPLWTLEHTASLLAAAEGNESPRVTMI
ncbi:MAG: FAD-dependent oxidoreductase, partial [Planctomycetota bacterium]|nr:FAD-dependent oxidoreductase [Planctomycetota bacterium]